MKRYDYLKQGVYKNNLNQILSQSSPSLKIIKKMIKERFKSYKNFLEYIKSIKKSNPSYNKILQNYFSKNQYFCYLNRKNSPRHPLFENLEETLPDRSTRIEEQLSYLDKISSNQYFGNEKLLEEEIYSEKILEEFDDYNYGNCLNFCLGQEGDDEDGISFDKITMFYYSNLDYTLSKLFIFFYFF